MGLGLSRVHKQPVGVRVGVRVSVRVRVGVRAEVRVHLQPVGGVAGLHSERRPHLVRVRVRVRARARRGLALGCE